VSYSHPSLGRLVHNNIDPTPCTLHLQVHCNFCESSRNPCVRVLPLANRRKTGTHHDSDKEPGSLRHWKFLQFLEDPHHYRDTLGRNPQHRQWSHRHIHQDLGSCHQTHSGILGHLVLEGHQYHGPGVQITPCAMVVVDIHVFLQCGIPRWWSFRNQCT